MPEKVRHLIYFNGSLKQNAGGPSGYLWHLKRGLSELSNGDQIEFIVNDKLPETTFTASKKNPLRSLKRFPIIWRILKSFGPTETRKMYKLYKKLLPDKVQLSVEETLRLLRDLDIQSIHCHTTHDTLKVHNALISVGKRSSVKLYITSHCPEIPANEIVDALCAQDLLRGMAEQVRAKLTAVDLAAFRSADELIFPSQESMEPYYETCPDFHDAIKDKPISFMLTGLVEPRILKTVSIPDTMDGLKLVYIGRHNSVKGYDLLTRTVPQFLNSENAWMIVAGSLGPLPAPMHPRWIELGWTDNAPGLLAAADILLLPNRRTYFDLVAIEAMALGVPLLTTDTGGNRTLAKLSEGVILFKPDHESLFLALKKMSLLGKKKLQELGKLNRQSYEQFLNQRSFALRYLEVLCLKS